MLQEDEYRPYVGAQGHRWQELVGLQGRSVLA
jgi:hypothetical protein